MNTFLELDTCLIAAIDNLMTKTSKRPENENELRDWIHNNSKKIGIEAKRLMTRYIIDVTADPIWYENTSSPGYRPEHVQYWKKYVI